MKASADQGKTPEVKPGAKDDLKTLPMAELQAKLGSSPEGLTQSRGGEAAGPVRTE